MKKETKRGKKKKIRGKTISQKKTPNEWKKVMSKWSSGSQWSSGKGGRSSEEKSREKSKNISLGYEGKSFSYKKKNKWEKSLTGYIRITDL